MTNYTNSTLQCTFTAYQAAPTGWPYVPPPAATD
ncbi:hypothetical protein ABIB17_003698 [Arthrobacter sp. UYEF6]